MTDPSAGGRAPLDFDALADRIVVQTEHLNNPRGAIATILRDALSRSTPSMEALRTASSRALVLLDAYNGMTLPIGVGEEVREVASSLRAILDASGGSEPTNGSDEVRIEELDIGDLVRDFEEATIESYRGLHRNDPTARYRKVKANLIAVIRAARATVSGTAPPSVSREPEQPTTETKEKK